MKEWFTASEMAELALPDIPATKRRINSLAEREKWQSPATEWHAERNPRGLWRRRDGRGGGVEYHYALLPSRAQAKLVTMFRPEPDWVGPDGSRQIRAALDRKEAWDHYAGLSDSKKDRAKEWVEILNAVRALTKGGTQKDLAVQLICDQRGIGKSTYYKREREVAGIDAKDWLPYMVDRRVGRTATTECDPEAWEFLKADWLRLEQRSFAACHRDLERAAAEHGWEIPSARTLERRLLDLPVAIRVFCREGLEALKRLYPAQERDRTQFHALEAANADGHRWDVWVQWPDGEISRPCMVAIQDLYSGMILSWRLDKTFHKDVVRLAIGDMVEQWGIPDYIWLDNGRDFASKWITGGAPNRYRFKVREEEPAGILTTLGVEVHWTTPYSGQSKPIERAFRDFCDNIAKHPAFAGAWTGNTVANKPENYGSKAVPLEDFIKVVADGILEHNTRKKRQSRVCRGVHSFLDVFSASYAQAPIRKVAGDDERRRLWLLAAESVRTGKRDGSIRLLDNRYWAEFLHAHLGQPMVIRFDPQDVHAGVHVYRLDGVYVGFAPCEEAAGFANADAAREIGRKRNAFMKATRAAAKLERSMPIEQVAALIPMIEEPPAPDSKVVRPMVFGNLVLKPTPADDAREEAEVFDFGGAFAKGVLRLVADNTEG